METTSVKTFIFPEITSENHFLSEQDWNSEVVNSVFEKRQDLIDHILLNIRKDKIEKLKSKLK